MRRLAVLLALAILAALGCAAYENSSTSNRGTTVTSTAGTPSKAPGVSGGIVRLPSGLQYEDLKVGDGPAASDGGQVSVHYTGWLADGTKFDSSLDRGTPLVFRLGQGSVIRGWDEGIRGMKAGGRRKLTIPPDLGYGAAGAQGVIPPNATLTFEVELVGVE